MTDKLFIESFCDQVYVYIDESSSSECCALIKDNTLLERHNLNMQCGNSNLKTLNNSFLRNFEYVDIFCVCISAASLVLNGLMVIEIFKNIKGLND